MSEEKNKRLTSGSEKTSELVRRLGCSHFYVREESTGFPLSGLSNEYWYARMVHCKEAREGSDTYCVGHIDKAPIVDQTINPQAIKRCPLYNKE